MSEKLTAYLFCLILLICFLGFIYNAEKEREKEINYIMSQNKALKDTLYKKSILIDSIK